MGVITNGEGVWRGAVFLV